MAWGAAAGGPVAGGPARAGSHRPVARDMSSGTGEHAVGRPAAPGSAGASSPAHRRRRVVRRREPHRVRALEGRRSHGARAPAPGIAAPISGAWSRLDHRGHARSREPDENEPLRRAGDLVSSWAVVFVW